MRNLNKPPRYNVASIQVQQTLGGDVMVADENGNYIEWRDYQWLLTEKQRLDSEVERLTELNTTLSLRYDATKSMLDGCAKEIEEMEAEVERLTKAGAILSKEAMVVMLNGGAHEELIKAHDDWKDLVDGKPNWGKTCTK